LTKWHRGEAYDIGDRSLRGGEHLRRPFRVAGKFVIKGRRRILIEAR
jgi:hypothetical protein